MGCGRENRLIGRINDEVVRANLDVLSGRVVDLGCGEMPYREAILKVAEEYIGVDWAESPLDISSADVVANLNGSFPFDDGFADSLVSFQVLEHIAEPDSFASECFRILKPGGRLLLTAPFMWQVHDAPHDYQRYTSFGLQRLFERAGFQDIRIEANSGYWQMAVLKFNYHTAAAGWRRLRWLLVPCWLIGQWLAPRLDRIDRDETETVSYTVKARKPEN